MVRNSEYDKVRWSGVCAAILLGIAILGALAVGSVGAQTVDSVDTNLSDTTGDGVQDSVSAEISVTDSGVTGVSLHDDTSDTGIEIDVSETDEGQAAITDVDNENNTITFAETMSSDFEYTIVADMTGQEIGDVVLFEVWAGAVDKNDADDLQEYQFTVEGDDKSSVEAVGISLSDSSGDGINDRAMIDVTVDGAGTTGVEILAPFDVNLSDTDEGQAAITDITGNVVVFGGLSAFTGNYTVIADMTGHNVGDEVSIDAWVGDAEKEDAADIISESFSVDEATGPLSSQNPFGGADNEPVSNLQAIQILDDWRNDHEINGAEITPLEMIEYLDEWRDA